jgi:hypothetical protein
MHSYAKENTEYFQANKEGDNAIIFFGVEVNKTLTTKPPRLGKKNNTASPTYKQKRTYIFS